MLLERDDSGLAASARPRLTPIRRGSPPAELVLDLSRLLSRVLHPTPTGVDRVELGYARGLLRHAPDRLLFSARHPIGRYGRLARSAVERFLDETEARWETMGEQERPDERVRTAMRWCARLRPMPVEPPPGARILLQVSPSHLDRSRAVAAKLARERAWFVCMVHDLIPIEHPEFARPDGAARHAARMATIARHADGIIANSAATARSLTDHLVDLAVRVPIRVVPLAVTGIAAARAQTSSKPYFLCLGTIEPRKNHLLLLQVWRALVARHGPYDTPDLVLAGRRGWENENVVDMLDRATALKPVVRERGRVSDAALRDLLAGACAVLMPSFAEGFGLPVAEALAAGVPVIASDLAAHREAGGDVPDYLDPLDGPAWASAVAAYAVPGSPRRAAQLARLTGWRPPTWDSHIRAALELIDEVAAA